MEWQPLQARQIFFFLKRVPDNLEVNKEHMNWLELWHKEYEAIHFMCTTYYIMILLPGNPVSFFSVMQNNFSEMREAQLQSIALVPEIILGIQEYKSFSLIWFAPSFFVQEKAVIHSLRFRNAINLQSWVNVVNHQNHKNNFFLLSWSLSIVLLYTFKIFLPWDAL